MDWWRLPDGSLEAELFEALSQVFSSPLTAFAGCTGYLFLGIWLISSLCMWLAHFAGHKQALRTVVGLYVLSILWVKVPGIHAFPITGLNHLLILHHNLGIPHCWLVTGITAALLALFLIGSVCFPSKRKLLGKSQKRRGVQAYYQRALFQKQDLMILCGVVLGMTVYKGLSWTVLRARMGLSPFLWPWNRILSYPGISGNAAGEYGASLFDCCICRGQRQRTIHFRISSIEQPKRDVSWNTQDSHQFYCHLSSPLVPGRTDRWAHLCGQDGSDCDTLFSRMCCFQISGYSAADTCYAFCYLLTRQITVGFLAILAGNFFVCNSAKLGTLSTLWLVRNSKGWLGFLRHGNPGRDGDDDSDRVPGYYIESAGIAWL